MSISPSKYVQIILPLPLPQTYTYAVPQAFEDQVEIGRRVVVQFGKQKLYSGLIYKTDVSPPDKYEAKEILDFLDDAPIVNEAQLVFWEWITRYYICSIGEVMSAALPSAMKINSETRLMLNAQTEVNEEQLTDKEYLVYEALLSQEVLSLDDVSSILGIKTIHPIVKSLIDKQIVVLEEEAKERYKPKTSAFVSLAEAYHKEELLRETMNDLSRAPKQTEVLMAFLEMSRFFTKDPIPVKKVQLQKRAKASSAQVQALVSKGILELHELEESRLREVEATIASKTLNEDQQKAYEAIQTSFEEKEVCLLHGVTSSGKTEVYIQLIEEVLEQGKQVLYLLPEIALTTQIIQRLQARFGEKVGIYHSRFNQHERVEVWKNMLIGKYQILLGTRSAIFLPFHNLDLIVVDEEHESSFKQFDPAPRYHARDAAVMLGKQTGARVLLGSATPSMESFHNTEIGRYGLVEMKKRFGGVQMPKIILADLKEEHQKKTMRSHFSSVLITELEKCVNNGEQAILFQNRRGFSPYIQCNTCGWTPECTRCDVNLTYHKHIHRLKCHYCGYNRNMPPKCEQCGSAALQLKGFGTEKIEDELALMYPHWKIKRLDLDTTRGKYAYEQILEAFDKQEIDVLVGTQMITKGLDFDHVGVVGILNADSMLNFPDFRAHERSYQLMAQVSGRAGRKQKQGKVVIQTFQPSHPIIELVQQNDYTGLYNRQSHERLQFRYPPYFRLMRFTVLHRDKDLVDDTSAFLAKLLRQQFGAMVLGPEYPVIARIKNRYHKQIMVKVEKRANTTQIRNIVQHILDQILKHPEFHKARIIPDVDPY